MNKYNYTHKENDYKTPPVLYRMALDYFKLPYGFSLDVCCTDENIPALYHYKNGEKDGLKEDWMGYNWCNPPYNECAKWIKKAYEEQQKGRKTAMLIPARTETGYWHKYIHNKENVKIDFLRKGYKFLDKNNKEMGIFKNALALVYFS